jgi:hypothetical protein
MIIVGWFEIIGPSSPTKFEKNPIFSKEFLP